MKEILIDSGGTKSDWTVISHDSVVKEFRTAGMNPVTADIIGILTDVNDVDVQNIKTVNFYGAGCATPALCEKVRTALQDKYLYSEVNVASDVMGAARAMCGRQPGIVIILGTGSSICRYSGSELTHTIPSGGYLIGDEGSGYDVGQAMIRASIRGQLLEEEQAILNAKLKGQDLLSMIYGHDQPNTLIASLASQLKFFNTKRRGQLLRPIFTRMIKERLLALQLLDGDKLYFVGSIAFHYQKELQDALNSFNLQAELIERSPMPGLISYHIGQTR